MANDTEQVMTNNPKQDVTTDTQVLENDTEKLMVKDVGQEVANDANEVELNDNEQIVANDAEHVWENVAEQAVAKDIASSLMEQLSQALLELKASKNFSEDNIRWDEIEEHFLNLETTLKRRSKELEAKENECQLKEAKIFALLEEREATVTAKEQDLQDRLQKLKDAVVADIAEARANHQPAASDSVEVSSLLGDKNSQEDFSYRMGEIADDVAAHVKPRPELTLFCEQMDAKGLLNFTMENQKNLYAICEELTLALKSAIEPARLVLDSLEGFYPPDEITQPVDKKDATLQGMRKSCLILMEAMAALLARLDSGVDHLLDPAIKQRAKAIADDWKPKLANSDIDAANINSLEAEAFLQLLSTFRIASEFDDEELCEIVLLVAHRRQAPELCRSLELTYKMPGIVESLINGGKQIDAVRFIHTFELTDRFPPVPLLKTYLKDIRRNSQGNGGNASGSFDAQGDVNAQELAALKAVIRCIEECKLQPNYPLDPLQKRVAQLERARSDKKRRLDSGKYHRSKKSRSNGGYRGFRQQSGGIANTHAATVRQAPPIFTERAAYPGIPGRYPRAGPTSYDYQVPGPSAYTQQSTDYDYQVPGQSAYTHQSADQRLYYHSQDDRIPAAPYNAASNYSGYLGSGIPPSAHQPHM
ncbi:putative Protein FRIGIDA [Tripterygium wilfordii]|uniref:FRIGIDA-like protein n=1 Tax=Tripterygium wilfordii TaxID=458696 RepID=A0A7J7CWC3_TRIWF|nr:FRIGIDA-like protein 3 [Tripterygium wilfordii]XP_038720547.1 FRIGIDA-like protein 3 [Tripterygium wilfordii]XP_038720548.1 FRIGIDA-like protein 3 [Tripterygium wilfordii]KAF5738239.1 putative Protein FRIGIDA [Tripterygium wilfordii]